MRAKKRHPTAAIPCIGLIVLGFTGCGPPPDEDLDELEQISSELSGLGPPLLPDPITADSWTFAVSRPIPEIEMLIADPGFISTNATFQPATSQFQFDGLHYHYRFEDDIVFGLNPLPANTLLVPPGGKVVGDGIQMPGKPQASFKQIGYLFGLAKFGNNRENLSELMKDKFGSDFGLNSRYVKKTWVHGYGGYTFGENAQGRGVPPGRGVSSFGKSYLQVSKAGRVLDGKRIRSWGHFLNGWQKRVDSAKAYESLVKPETGGVKAKAMEALAAERKALGREAKYLVKGAMRTVSTTSGMNTYNRWYSSANGSVAIRLHFDEDPEQNLRVFTRDRTLNGLLEERRQQLIDNLNAYEGRMWRQIGIVTGAALAGGVVGAAATGGVGTLLGVVIGAAGGLAAAAVVADHDVDALFRNYFHDVNRLLRRHGYPVIDDVEI